MMRLILIVGLVLVGGCSKTIHEASAKQGTTVAPMHPLSYSGAIRDI